MIDIYTDEKMIENAAAQNVPYTSKYFGTEKPKLVTSMKDIEGFV